jgi:hypothetical protein
MMSFCSTISHTVSHTLDALRSTTARCSGSQPLSVFTCTTTRRAAFVREEP